MGKPYSAELAELPRTFAWAMASDITGLRQAVRTSGLYPLLAVGSGGSLTAAHALAALHRKRTSRLAAVATPLEAVAEPLEESVATWLISAGGRNADILAAFRALVAREARQLCVLCGREGSSLTESPVDMRMLTRSCLSRPQARTGSSPRTHCSHSSPS